MGIDPIQISKIRERNEILSRNNIKSGLRALPGTPASRRQAEEADQAASLPPNPLAIRDELREIAEGSTKNGRGHPDNRKAPTIELQNPNHKAIVRKDQNEAKKSSKKHDISKKLNKKAHKQSSFRVAAAQGLSMSLDK